MSKSLIEVLAVGYLLGMSIMFMVVFNNAVLYDGGTLVTINDYGEMVPELILLHFVVWPTITVGLYLWHKRQ